MEFDDDDLATSHAVAKAFEECAEALEMQISGAGVGV